VVHKPDSLAALSGLSGVGEKKMERYGEIFLKVISRFRSASR